MFWFSRGGRGREAGARSAGAATATPINRGPPTAPAPATATPINRGPPTATATATATPINRGPPTATATATPINRGPPTATATAPAPATATVRPPPFHRPRPSTGRPTATGWVRGVGLLGGLWGGGGSAVSADGQLLVLHNLTNGTTPPPCATTPISLYGALPLGRGIPQPGFRARSGGGGRGVGSLGRRRSAEPTRAGSSGPGMAGDPTQGRTAPIRGPMCQPRYPIAIVAHTAYTRPGGMNAPASDISHTTTRVFQEASSGFQTLPNRCCKP
eukprot:412681-Prorocentrum_minimum.AAC.2